jgi:hypothetical protein
MWEFEETKCDCTVINIDKLCEMFDYAKRNNTNIKVVSIFRKKINVMEWGIYLDLLDNTFINGEGGTLEQAITNAHKLFLKKIKNNN